MHILIDLDDTAVGWNIAKDRELKARYPHLTKFRHGKDIISWDLFDGLDEEHAAAMQELMDSPGFYASMEPLPGAVEAAHEMVAKGHEVSFVSTPWASNPTCMADKFNTLEKYWGSGWGNRLALMYDKTAHRGDVLFDDKNVITGHYTPEWSRVIFDQPHNQGIPGLRLFEWKDWEDVLDLAIFERQEERDENLRNIVKEAVASVWGN